MIVVTTALPDRERAEELARALVEEGLAACVQLRAIDSVYRWEGDVVTDGEIALDAKTPVAFERVADAIRERHPYDVPEVLAVEVADVDGAYADWADEVTEGA